MAIVAQIQTHSDMKLRAGVGIASLLVVGCFCAAILLSGTQQSSPHTAAHMDNAATHLVQSNVTH